jgi:8-oxo-dGTP diphosphatase
LKKKNIYVSTVALIDWQGKVLISLRSEDKILPNYWEFPGGKIKTNESPDHAIIREIKEELTLDINKKSLKPLSFNTHTYEEFHAVIFFYICRSWNSTPLSKNKQKILWVEIDKLKNYNFLPGSSKFVLELNKLKKK